MEPGPPSYNFYFFYFFIINEMDQMVWVGKTNISNFVLVAL